MSRSFQEKSSWVTFVAVVVAFGFYFAVSLPGATVDIRPHQVFRFAGFVVICIGVFVPGNFAFTHALLGAWVLAQLVETGSQLWLYRREA
ncbi:MAG: hypothetical protein IPK64_03410 [bacterium]|nr:hypothetical protein [bacterium]